MARDICCQNFKGLIAYIRHHYGEEGVNTLLEGLVNNPKYLVRDKFDPSILHAIQQNHLTDSAYWVSNDFSIALFENVKKIIKVPNPLITAGIGAVRESLQLESQHLPGKCLFGLVASFKTYDKMNFRSDLFALFFISAYQLGSRHRQDRRAWHPEMAE